MAAGFGRRIHLWFAAVEPAEPLDTRARVLARVRLYPGVHQREIAAQLGLPPSQVAYHLRVLARTGFVTREDEAGFSRFYPTQTTVLGPLPALGAEDRRLLRLLRRPGPLQVLVHLSLDGDLTLGDIAMRCGNAPSTVLYHLRHLQEGGVVRQTGEGKGSRWGLVDPARTRALLLAHEPPPRLVSGFLDTWQRLVP